MRRARGFSLVEMVVVVALFAAIAAIGAAVVGRALPGQQLRTTARDLAADLRYTRARAIASGREQLFVFAPDQRRWQAADERTGRWPESLEASATTARGIGEDARTAAVRFFPDGSASGGRFVFHYGDAAWRVDVAWLTGEVTLRRGEGEP